MPGNTDGPSNSVAYYTSILFQDIEKNDVLKQEYKSLLGSPIDILHKIRFGAGDFAVEDESKGIIDINLAYGFFILGRKSLEGIVFVDNTKDLATELKEYERILRQISEREVIPTNENEFKTYQRMKKFFENFESQSRGKYI